MNIIRSSIRLKLTVATLIPLSVAVLLFYFIGSFLLTSKILEQAQLKVESDLNSAHEILISEQSRINDIVRLISISPDLSTRVNSIESSRGANVLSEILRNEKLSFLTVVDRYGTVRYRAANPSKTGDEYALTALLNNALTGEPASGLILISQENAGLENPTLPGIMYTKVIPTPHSRPDPKTVENRGLMFVSASPLRSPNGVITGVVCAGILLNAQHDLVDKITRVVFNRSEEGGYATVFLDDVRISTTLLNAKGDRAIGTRMSEEVYGSIINREKWVGRAFVLNDWHYSAYEPLLDIQGEVVGALFVGTPEAPFLKARDRIRMMFAGVILLVTILGVTISATLGERMARPVKALEEGARRIASGEPSPDISVDSHDEIAALADEFNVMKSRLQVREDEILTLNRTLEQKVDERTAELEERGAQLLETQAELARAERLAGLGMLSAGVAHEINNPLAIIRGNAELLQMSHPPDSSDGEEVDAIMRQVSRIERIVRNLLVFSRGSAKQIAPLSLGALLEEILNSVHHQIQLDRFEVKKKFPDSPVIIGGDEDQLRQVFTNLIVNALQAMDKGGVLEVAVSVDGSAGLCSVRVSDTGPGISEEQRSKLFTPFFTTKPGGTGLGLAVSYGIVKDHGGNIHAESESGTGTSFIVTLPLRQKSGQSASIAAQVT